MFQNTSIKQFILHSSQTSLIEKKNLKKKQSQSIHPY